MLPLAKLSQSGQVKLILASGSARRKLLLENAGFKFDCCTSDFPEDLDKSSFSSAEEYVRATSLGKLNCLPELKSSNIIQITCDTVLVKDFEDGGGILEKPCDYDEAFKMISGLIGKRFKVVSVVHLRSFDKTIWFQEVSEVLMRSWDEINDSDISGYLEDVNYKDFSGALAIQSSGMVLVKEVKGCYNNIMGFPLSTFYQKLKELI